MHQVSCLYGLGKTKMQQEVEFRVRKIFGQHVLDKGLSISTDRLAIQVILDDWGNRLVQGMLAIATQEDREISYPADWWQAFKFRWFPEWALRRWPVKRHHIIAIHKFPEVTLPNEFAGHEYVHFKVMDDEELGITM